MVYSVLRPAVQYRSRNAWRKPCGGPGWIRSLYVYRRLAAMILGLSSDGCLINSPTGRASSDDVGAPRLE